MDTRAWRALYGPYISDVAPTWPRVLPWFATLACRATPPHRGGGVKAALPPRYPPPSTSARFSRIMRWVEAGMGGLVPYQHLTPAPRVAGGTPSIRQEKVPPAPPAPSSRCGFEEEGGWHYPLRKSYVK